MPRVQKARMANEEQKKIQQQLQRTAEQRLEQLRALGQSKKLRNVNTASAQGKTGRHMEGNIDLSMVQTKTGASAVPAKGAIPAMASSFLRSVPLFHSLEETQLNLLQQNLTVQTITNGQVICRQDTPGDLFYLLFHGIVRVYEEEDLPRFARELGRRLYERAAR